MDRQRRARSDRARNQQPELSLATAPRGRSGRVLEPDEVAKLVIARRTKPGALLGRVRLVLTLELRRALAEHLSARAIRSVHLLAARNTTSAERTRRP